MRAVRYILWSVTVLLIVLVLTTLVLAAHPGGLRWLAARADSVVPGTLSIEAPRGSLLGEMGADRIRYRNDVVEVIVEQLQLRVRLLPLLAGELRLAGLTADYVSIQLTDADAAPAADDGLPEVDIPLALRLVSGRLRRLELQSGARRETLQDVDLTLTLRGSRLGVARFSANRAGVSLQLSGELRMTERWPLEAAGAWALAETDFSGAGKVAGDLKELRVSHTLRVPDPVYAEAEVTDPLGRLQFSARANWSEVRLPVAPAREPTLLPGKLRAQGSAEDFTLELKSGLRAAPFGVGELEARLQGNSRQIDIRALSLTVLQGRVRGTGQVQLAQQVAQLQLSAAGLQLQELDSRLPELQSLTAVVSGWPDQQITATVVDSQLRTPPATARFTGALTATADQIVVDRAAVRIGANAARFTGAVWPEVAGSFELSAPVLEQVDPRVAGELTASGRVVGSLPALEGRLQLSATNLHWDQLQAGQLSADAEFGANAAVEIRVDGEAIAWANSGDHEVALSATGSLAQLQLLLTGSGAAGSARARATAGWTEEQLQVELAEAALAPVAAPSWTLSEPAKVRVTRPGTAAVAATVSAHCWAAAPAELCLDDSVYSSAELRLRAWLRDLPLATLQPVLEQLDSRYSWSGIAAADVELNGRPDAPVIALDWRQRDTVLSWQESSASVRQATFPQLELAVTGDGTGVQISSSTASVGGAEIKVNGTAGAWRAGATTLELQVDGRLPDIAVLAPVIEANTPLQDPQGVLRVDLRIGGQLDAPTLAGSAVLRDGRAQVPLTGIELSDINASLQSTAPRAAAVSASLRSGTGELTLGGDVVWREGFSAELQLQGEDVQVLRFPEQAIWASPDLRITADTEKINVTGTLTVPRADVVIAALPATATAPSPDVVVIRDAPATEDRAVPLDLSADVQVVAGEDVRLRAFGLDTELAGALQLQTDGATQGPVVQGSLRSRNGQFSAYGRDLAIERGVLVFTGDAENPDVNVRAVRTLRYEGQDIKIGVQLTGPLNNMTTRLFGEPSMSESDALSFLVLNRPMERSEGAEQEQLSGAAVALGVVNLLPTTERVKDSLGLDEIEFSGMTRESSAIIAGKRISDDFYIRYSYGLFERIGRFILRYDIGRGLSLEAGSGQEQTIDLLYSIDR